GAAAREDVRRLAPDPLERHRRDPHGRVVAAEAIPGRHARDLRVDLTLLQARREGDGLEQLANQVGELALVVAAYLGGELAPFWDRVGGSPARDAPDVR